MAEPPLPPDNGIARNSKGAENPASGLANQQRALGGRIRSLREHKNLTLEDVADNCSISAADMARIEAGEFEITLTTLVSIAQQLGITAESLLEGI